MFLLNYIFKEIDLQYEYIFNIIYKNQFVYFTSLIIHNYHN